MILSFSVMGFSSLTQAQVSSSSTLDMLIKNPECRTIVDRIKSLTTPTGFEAIQIQQTVESMDEFKVSMVGEGYRFVIDSMLEIKSSGAVRSDVLLAAECDRLMEDTRLARTEKSALEFNKYLMDAREARQIASSLSSDRRPAQNNSCGTTQERTSLLLNPDCSPISLTPILPESSRLLREVSTRLGETYKIETPTSLIDFRPLSAAQMLRGSINAGTSPLKRSNFITLDRFGDKDCDCATQTMTSLLSVSDPNEFKAKESKLRDDLNQMLFTSFGNKFENDFANNFEDLSYFMNTNAKVFPNEETMNNLQCANQESYKNAIKAKCGSKSSSEIDDRLKKIIGVTQSELGDKLKQIAVSATGVKTGHNHPDGSPVMYTREDMDGQRRQLLSDLPELRFYDRMFYKLLTNTNARKSLDENLIINDPQSAVYTTMVNSLRSDPAFLESLDPSLKTSGFVKSIKRLLAANDHDGLHTLLSGVLTNLQDNYPGFKSLLRSKEKLANFRFSNPKENGSLSEELEKEQSYLNGEFNKRCSDLQENLAEAVCAEEESILTKADPREVERLIVHKRPDLIDQYDIYSDLLCRTRGQATPAFSGLNVDMLPISQQSDYSLRKIAEEKKLPPRDILTSFMHAFKDKKLKAYMEDSARTIASRRDAYTGAGRLGGDMLANNSKVRRFDPKFEKKPGSDSYVAKKAGAASNVAAAADAVTEKLAETRAEEVIPTVRPQVTPVANYQNAVIPTQVFTNNDSKDRASMKAALREYVNEREASAESERMLSDVDNEQLRELNRLKTLSDQNRSELSRLSREREQVRISEMENKIKALEDQRTEVAQAISERRPSRNSERSNGRVPASVSRSEVSEAASLPTRVNLQNAVTRNPENSTVSSAPLKPFVVKGADLPASLEVKATKMSDELLDYLSKNETEISSLIQIKDAGMLYKFKVKENGQWVEKEILVNYDALTDDVKKLIDQKIAQNSENGARLVKLDEEIKELRRSHSYASLRNIITEQVRR